MLAAVRLVRDFALHALLQAALLALFVVGGVWIVTGSPPAFAATLPPVTQAEAVEFHRRGFCVMAEPGQGITRPDGRGWIASSLPGVHEIRIGDDRALRLDLTPGRPVQIVVRPGDSVTWCPRDARPAGRAECGPVPPAFLYNAKLATD